MHAWPAQPARIKHYIRMYIYILYNRLYIYTCSSTVFLLVPLSVLSLSVFSPAIELIPAPTQARTYRPSPPAQVSGLARVLSTASLVSSVSKRGLSASSSTSRWYTRTPFRKTCLLIRSSWSCINTCVRLMGEKPNTGIPVCMHIWQNRTNVRVHASMH